MTTAWPGTIPTAALVTDSGYNEGGEDNVAQQKPQVGPPLRRRRSSVPSRLVSFSTIMTYAQWDLLVTFYEQTLFDGVDFFTRPHPRTLASIMCTFEDRPKSGQSVAFGKYQVSMVIRTYQ